MEFFEASGNWIVALGKTLVHSLWVGLLFLSLLKIILQTLPGRYSHIRYRIALISLLLFIGLLGGVFILLYTPVYAGATIGMQTAFQIPDVIPLIHEFAVNSDGTSLMSICSICSYIYFTGIFIMLIRSIISIIHIQQLKRNGVPVQNEWIDRFLQIKHTLGIKRNVALLESDRINAPAMIGLFKPAIMVPLGMFTHLSVEQVETILMHELHHLRRLDFLVNIIQLIAEGLFFYNPAVWTISQMIRSERENCCDDRVIQSCRDPIVYAGALFQLAGQQQSLHRLMPGAGGSDQYQLFNRIKRILNQTTMKTNIREKLFSLLILAGGMILLLTISGFSSGFSIVKQNDSWKKMNTITSSPATNPAPNPTLILPQDTLPSTEKEITAAKEVALAEIDWEEIEREIKAAKEVAIDEINWDQIKEEMEMASLEAMDSIDWDEIKEEMAKAKIHIDSVMQDFDFDFDMDFDMEEFKIEMKDAMKEIEEIDWEEIKREIEESMEEIDWEEIKKEMENVHIHLDSLLHDIDHDSEHESDHDHDVE